MAIYDRLCERKALFWMDHKYRFRSDGARLKSILVFEWDSTLAVIDDVLNISPN